jgi:integrase
VGLETGITPVEVEEARVHWYDKERAVLEIPQEYASKNRPTSELPVTDATAELMSKWIQERRHYEKYDGTERLWLNQKGNPFDSANLCDLVRRLCEEAGIKHENRKIVWYSLRHNVGQSIEEIEDLSEARDQLRHDSIETTKQFYAETAIESRRETLERVNETAQRTVEDPMFNPYRDDAETQNQSYARYPDENTRSASVEDSGANKIHIDTSIKDTTEARNKLAKDILDGDDSQ